MFCPGPIGLSNGFGGPNRFRAGRLRFGVYAARALKALVFFALVLCSGPTRAQEAPPLPPQSNEPTSLPGQAVLNSAGRCVQPPPMVQLKDYNGPFHKVVGTFTQKLDRQSVRDPHYKQGSMLCSLQVKDKFFLFLHDAIDPETVFSAGFNAGISQAENDDPSFGQGGKGYGLRLAVSYTDQVQSLFFKEFAYPTIFSEDPRYYRIGPGICETTFPARHGTRGRGL